MTGISATIAKMKPPVFPQLSRRDDCDKHLSLSQPLSNYKRCSGVTRRQRLGQRGEVAMSSLRQVCLRLAAGLLLVKSTYYANGSIHLKPGNHNSLDLVLSCAVAVVCLEPQSLHFCTVALRLCFSRASFCARSDAAKPHPCVHRSSSRVLEQYQKAFEPPYSSRPASGFLLVSFSKVTRQLLRLFAPTFVAESLPNNANDYP